MGKPTKANEMNQEIVIDIRTTDLTMREVVAEVNRMQAEDPEHEYALDGDLYAIVRKG